MNELEQVLFGLAVWMAPGIFGGFLLLVMRPWKGR